MQERKDAQESLLSIVVPVYNVERYLDRCVESLVHQTYRNLEIILVDDGSPDNCPGMCDAWAGKDSRIRVIHKENGGLSDARNAGIGAATGDLLAFVDSDDYVDTSMYEIMLSAMDRTGADVACCGRYIAAGEILTPMHTLDRETVFPAREAVKELLLGGKLEEATWDKMYRRHLFEGVAFPKGENNEDIVVIPRLLLRASSVVHVGRPLYYYWQNPGSITKSAYSRKKRVILKHLDQVKQFLTEECPDLLPYYPVLQARYCQTTLYLLLDNKTVLKQYRQDYLEFYRGFRESFRVRLSAGVMDTGEKLKGLLIYCRLYFFLHELKKLIGKDAHGNG